MLTINWIEWFWILCNNCEVGGILLQRQSIWITTGRTRVWGSRGCYWGKWKWKRERKSLKRLNLVHQIFVETLQQTSAPAASGDQMTASEKVKVNIWDPTNWMQLQVYCNLKTQGGERGGQGLFKDPAYPMVEMICVAYQKHIFDNK